MPLPSPTPLSPMKFLLSLSAVVGLSLLLAAPSASGKDLSRPTATSGYWVHPSCADASYDRQESSSCRRINEEDEDS